MKRSALALLAGSMLSASAFAGYTIQDYNNSLPVWGTTWKSGNNSINGYYPSFYTGFAARQSNPSRIHIRLAHLLGPLPEPLALSR